MRVNWNYIKMIGLVLMTGFLYAFASHRNGQRQLADIRVQFDDESTPFVSRAVVNKLLIQNESTVKNSTKEKLALKVMEAQVKSHPIIKNAEIYVEMDGTLGVQIEQRKPIARLSGASSFYLDGEGKKMPLSDNYSARVPLVTGVSDEDLSEVFDLIQFVKADSFLEKHIVGLEKLNNGDYILTPRKLEYKVLLGKVNKLPLKFNNYKAFYKKAQNDKTLNSYDKITLKYDNQVVCTTKNTGE